MAYGRRTFRRRRVVKRGVFRKRRVRPSMRMRRTKRNTSFAKRVRRALSVETKIYQQDANALNFNQPFGVPTELTLNIPQGSGANSRVGYKISVRKIRLWFWSSVPLAQVSQAVCGAILWREKTGTVINTWPDLLDTDGTWTTDYVFDQPHTKRFPKYSAIIKRKVWNHSPGQTAGFPFAAGYQPFRRHSWTINFPKGLLVTYDAFPTPAQSIQLTNRLRFQVGSNLPNTAGTFPFGNVKYKVYYTDV